MRKTCKSDSFLDSEFGLEEGFGFKRIQAKGDKGGSSTTTTRPFPAQEAALTRLFDRSEDQFQRGGQQFFPGETLAAQDQETINAQNSALGKVQGLDQFGDATLASSMSAVNAANFGTPEFEALSQGLTNPIVNRFQEDLLPSIRSQAAAGGAFGGSRQGINEAVASREVARAMADSRTGLYQTGQENLARLIGLQPQLKRTVLAGSDIQNNVGAAREGRAQAEINAARERWEFEQQAPEIALDRLAARISGINVGGTTTTTGSGGGGGFNGSGAMGGAMMGAKLGSVVPGLGTVVGAIGGGLMGGLF